MFGLGFWEIGVILVVALIVFGPKQLPQLARKLGEGLREFRSATNSFKNTMDQEMYREPPPAEPPKHDPSTAPAALPETAALPEAAGAINPVSDAESVKANAEPAVPPEAEKKSS